MIRYLEKLVFLIALDVFPRYIYFRIMGGGGRVKFVANILAGIFPFAYDFYDIELKIFTLWNLCISPAVSFTVLKLGLCPSKYIHQYFLLFN